jgi:hypothetical protein
MSNGNVNLTHQSPGRLASSIDGSTPGPNGRITASARTSVWGAILRTLGVATIDQRVDALAVSSRPIWSQAVAINAAIALLLSAASANASRDGYEWAVPGFYLSIALLFFPAIVRLALPDTSRSERIANLIIAALGLFMLRVIRAPQSFTGFDEYLHWATAQNIVERGHLFTPNVLLPIGPSFPGLEVVVTAITQLSGVSIFVSAIVCLAVARILFVGALFLIYERISGSARVAALGCVFYMGCSTFVFFDTSFSYESFAMPLLALALLLDLRMRAEAKHALTPLFLAFLIALQALAMTHHVTAFALAGILLGYAGLELARGGPRAVGFPLGLAAVSAVLLPVAWSQAMGNPGTAYLGPVFENALRDVSQLLQFGSATRKMFTSDDGTIAPLWQRLTTITSVALTCLGLAFGFFRSLSWAGVPFARGLAAKGWSSIFGSTNSRLVLLTLLTLLYPVSIVFRFTRSGWEIGNRIGPFAFLGVGVVLAIWVTTLIPVGTRGVWRAMGTAVAATVMLLGGIISSEGPRILVPAKYQVSADAASIEPMGIGAALWTKEWLGAGNHFAADRINRLLLTTFGRQLVSTTLQHGYDAGKILVAGKLDAEEMDVLQKLRIDYLFADLRLTTGMPVVGAYFDGAAADQMLTAPPQADALLKFNGIDGVSRVFDDGYAIVFDVRGLSGKQ